MSFGRNDDMEGALRTIVAEYVRKQYPGLDDPQEEDETPKDNRHFNNMVTYYCARSNLRSALVAAYKAGATHREESERSGHA